jgi:hypothetical protein
MRQNENIAESMLKIVDTKIEEILREGAHFNQLSKLYWSFGRDLTEIAGTMAGFTGLSEYIVLRAIIFFLEKEFESVEKSVRPKPPEPTNEPEGTNIPKFFVSFDKNILITHSISINAKMNKKLQREIVWSKDKRKRPDIVIFRLKNGRYEPVAIVQVKTCQVNPRAIDTEINTLNKIAIGDYLKIIVFFQEPTGAGKKKLKEFVDSNRNRAFVILPEEPPYFEDILNKIKKSVA